MSLIGLAYISRATFKSYPSARGVEPNVGRILITSRRNNAALGVVGGLYYGDGCFFQYLEGEETAVRALFDTIAADPRHRDVRVVLDKPIDVLSFHGWLMKYVPVAKDVERFLQRHQLRAFDPYRFDGDMYGEMVGLIQRGSNRDPGAERRGGGRRWAMLAVGAMAIVALAVAWSRIHG